MVVTHKEAPMPVDKRLYVPTLVGKNKDKLIYDVCYRDDQGQNIAEKNPNYCELTALYWAWKNLDADYIGLVHYRRLFMGEINTKEIVNQEELDRLLDSVDVLLPRKRNYYIENTWSHYKNNHNISDLIELRNIIEEKFPGDIPSFDKVMKNVKSHRFNMLIMKKDKFDAYSKWLFELLFELEKRIDISNYDAYQSRIYGFLSERLLDVWLDAYDIAYEELPFKFTEKQNWLVKGTKFIINKFK